MASREKWELWTGTICIVGICLCYIGRISIVEYAKHNPPTAPKTYKQGRLDGFDSGYAAALAEGHDNGVLQFVTKDGEIIGHRWKRAAVMVNDLIKQMDQREAESHLKHTDPPAGEPCQ